MTEKRKNIRRLALGGITAGFCVTFLLLGGSIPGLSYCGPVLALLAMAPAVLVCGSGWSLLIWGAASLLAFFLVPDRECSLLFLALGWYPALRPKLSAIRPKALSVFLKLLLFYLVIYLVYTLLIRLFVGPIEDPLWMRLLLFLFGGIAFLLCDLLLGRATAMTKKRIKE